MHQLKIIDKDYLNTLLPLQAFCLGGKLGKRDSRSLIDIHRSLHEFLDAFFKNYPFVRSHFHLAFQLVCRNAGLRRYQTVGEFHACHLQREECNRFVELDGRIPCKVQRKRSLSDRRSGTQDNEVAFLPAHSELVEGRKTGMHTSDAVAVLHTADPLHGKVCHLADMLVWILFIAADRIM